jgi:hypothetical protein
MSLDSRNEALDKELERNPVDIQVEALAEADKRQRRQVLVLAFTVAFDVLLTFAFGYITLRTHQLASEAETNRTALVRNCETANESRKNQRELWAYVISLTPSQPRTDEQTARVESFQKFVDKTFAPRDCNSEVNK